MREKSKSEHNNPIKEQEKERKMEQKTQKVMLHGISRLNVSGFNETMICLEDLKGRTHGQKATGVDRPSTLRCLSQFFSEKQSSNFRGVMLEKTYPDLMQESPYIESLGTVICLVTSPKFVGISKFRHNLHNGYRSYNFQSYPPIAAGS